MITASSSSGSSSGFGTSPPTRCFSCAQPLSRANPNSPSACRDCDRHECVSIAGLVRGHCSSYDSSFSFCPFYERSRLMRISISPPIPIWGRALLIVAQHLSYLKRVSRQVLSPKLHNVELRSLQNVKTIFPQSPDFIISMAS